MKGKDILYLVVPCYNEEQVLPETVVRLTGKLEEMIGEQLVSEKSRILLVDDGSKDHTWQLIARAHAENTLVCGLKLSRNKGHQNALLAGLMFARKHCDMAVSLDADLQDDISVLNQFVEKYYAGNEIVYGVRNSRKTDSGFKRFTAQSFYRFMKLLGVDLLYNHADYRLMSRRALEALADFKEVNLFLRGIVPLIGFQSDTVEYARQERFAGESKYPLRKMLGFAFDGITSFSIKPIRMITALGMLIFSVSIVMLLYFLIIYCMGKTVAGWATIVISVWAIGGLQLLGIGVIGEYIGKIYMESKARPKYIVETQLGLPAEEIQAE